ncbi:MAG: IS200/IS605 family transposase [Bacteroidales bacterium]|jgi:putative transposase|nr:IS200/IS605 family transposase [Bacteroidales bacterium]
MGQSLVKQYTHIIFSTKYQKSLIIDSVENELYKYIGGICKNMESYPVKVGGYRNHVHILCLLSKKIALMKLLEEVKSHSSKWVKTIDKRMNNFYWQNGYGAFSVNPSQVDKVRAYIENQHEHHRRKTFQEEYFRIPKGV